MDPFFYFKKLEINKEKSRDTGMAAILVLLILALVMENLIYVKVSLALLVIAMITPLVFKPLAYIWFGFANVAGAFFSKVLLTVIYFTLVLPVGMIRRISGKDPLRLRQWKKSTASVLNTRNHTYISSDIEKPF